MARIARCGVKMSWFGQTDEAQIHRQDCNGCEKCVWIEESSHAMMEYGIPIEKTKHPLFNIIMEKFDGKKVE